MAAIVDLKEATALGFTSVDRRIDGLEAKMNARFEAVDGRFESLEYKMNKRFDSVDRRFDAFERRLQAVEHKGA